MSGPEETCLFRLKFTPPKKINRKENLCSAPSLMRKWTRPFIIQPNYVQSKTVYLPRTRNTRLPYIQLFSNIDGLIEPPHGQSKLFCINLCFRIFFSLHVSCFAFLGDGKTLIEFRHGNHFSIEAISMDTIFMGTVYFHCPFFYLPTEQRTLRAHTHSVAHWALDQPQLDWSFHHFMYIRSLQIVPFLCCCFFFFLRFSSFPSSFWLTSSEIDIFPW